MRVVLFCLGLSLGVLYAGGVEACSAFLLKGKDLWMGKSYDWHDGGGALLVNKRKVRKVALLLPGSKLRPARWTSRYGSVTFNQHGREAPLGGINEKGLAIEVLWLHQTRLGLLSTKRPTVNELQWIQYHLDTSASLKQMVQSAKKLQIQKLYARVHYFACDASGACGTFEMLGGRLVVHHGNKLPVPALTNSTYKQSIRHFRQRGGMKAPPKHSLGFDSLSRFERVGGAIRHLAKAKRSRTKAFQILRSARMGPYSKWHIVYNLTKRRISFRRANATKQAWSIDTKTLDFGCASPVQVMSLDGKRRWRRYSAKQNAQMVRQAARRLFGHRSLLARYYLAYRMRPLVNNIIRYPQTTRCLSLK